MEKKNGREIVLTGHTLSAPYEVDFTIGNIIYIYGACYNKIRKCLFIDRKSKFSGKKALNFIKRIADYCIKKEEE